MRILPPLTAAAVAVVLYVAVFQRETLVPPATEDSPAAEPSPSLAEDNAVSVVAIRSTAQSVADAILTRGRTEAARQVEVKSQTSGLVLSEPLRRGAFVTKGQTLCQLEPGTRAAQAAEAQARLAEARARLAAAETEFDAANRLNEGGYASDTRRISAQADLESARAGVQSAEAGVAAITVEINHLVLSAPFEGLLETDTAELGSLLQPGNACAIVIQLNPIKIVGFLPEAEVDRVTVGAIAKARLVTGREVAGRVTFLSRSADAATRTFRVEITAENADLSIRDGQTAELVIAAEGVQAHLVPASSLTLDDQGRLGLRVVTPENTTAFTPVAVLRDTTEGVYVTGLPETADIVTVGQEFVRDGSKVAVTYAPPTPGQTAPEQTAPGNAP